MDAFPQHDEADVPFDASSAWTASCVSTLLARHGIGSRQQATSIAQICAISVSQARRKLRGSAWLFSEVLAVCRHFNESLDAVFGFPEATLPPTRGGRHPHIGTPGTLLVDDLHLHCRMQLGALRAALPSPSDAAGQDLLATLHDDAWLVGSATRLTRTGLRGPFYRVDHLQLDAPPNPRRARIAVLDDDPIAAHALSDWFNEVGFESTPYTDPDALTHDHDAYVVDLILSGGQTSQGVVERIRREQPDAPIVLLTGQLRDGTASESTLTTILRTQGVTFFEKPVRPAVLTAAIQSSLDRVASAS